MVSLHFFFISRTDIIADHRRSGDGDSHIEGNEEIVNIHDDGYSGDAIFTKEFHDDQIKQKCGDSCGHLRQHFTASVGAGLQKNRPVQFRFTEFNMAVLQEVDESDQHADKNGKQCSPCSAERPQMKQSDKDVVKDDVENQSDQRHDQSDLRFSIGSDQILKK